MQYPKPTAEQFWSSPSAGSPSKFDTDCMVCPDNTRSRALSKFPLSLAALFLARQRTYHFMLMPSPRTKMGTAAATRIVFQACKNKKLHALDASNGKIFLFQFTAGTETAAVVRVSADELCKRCARWCGDHLAWLNLIRRIEHIHLVHREPGKIHLS